MKVIDVNELRTALGLYAFGEYTEKMTLKSIDTTPGYGVSDEKSYAYYNITVENERGLVIKMKYKVYEAEEGLKLEDYKNGGEYTVKFTVEEGNFETEYTILDVK